MRKAIMKGTQLQYSYFKTRSSGNFNTHKLQRIFCGRLYKAEKKKYFNNLDLNKITHNKVFWKTLKPLLSDKGMNTTRIFLINDNKMIAKDKSFKYLINVF